MPQKGTKSTKEKLPDRVNLQGVAQARDVECAIHKIL
jgi:hypothetical protein